MLQDFETPAKALEDGLFYEYEDLLVHVELCGIDPNTDEPMTADQIRKIDLPIIPEPPPERSLLQTLPKP